MSKRKKKMDGQTCRVCGCTQDNACDHEVFGPCWWVERDLCSHCFMIASGQVDRDQVEQPGDRACFSEESP